MSKHELWEGEDEAGGTTPLGRMIGARLSRRRVLQSAAAIGAMSGTASFTLTACAQTQISTLTFAEVKHAETENHAVAAGYDADILIRWGDPILEGASAFDPNNITAETQAQQFGNNNDFIAFMPLPLGSVTSDHGLLCVNHEFSWPNQMFAGMSMSAAPQKMTPEKTRAEWEAMGHSVVEISKADGVWSVVDDSDYNRRITMTTPMRVAGPAAGAERMKTTADPTGKTAIGTAFNCAGGKTPWGTVLFAEENFQAYFSGKPNDGPEKENLKRYGLHKGRATWHASADDRFDVSKEPNEPNRFGWMVEYDPYDPSSIPVKRTGLGRFRHEGGTCVTNTHGEAVVYLGDDGQFQFIYRYVSNRKVNLMDRSKNADLFDKGVLYVGEFFEDGRLVWHPMIQGQGPLTAENGFNTQADVLIEARRAGELLGATPMDRPEDIETNPTTGTVFVMLTNNANRDADEVNPANPRGPNRYGHILELTPPGAPGPGADHAADIFTWDIFIKAGDPNDDEAGASYHAEISANGWFGSPDNCAFDPKGRLWIATDGAPKGLNNGAWACDVVGEGRALTRHFYRTPNGAELCGPEFTPDGKTLFVSIQHPGLAGQGSVFDDASSKWPDFKDGMPPRSSVVAITKADGGDIGD
jgi:hypothetical protein